MISEFPTNIGLGLKLLGRWFVKNGLFDIRSLIDLFTAFVESTTMQSDVSQPLQPLQSLHIGLHAAISTATNECRYTC